MAKTDTVLVSTGIIRCSASRTWQPPIRELLPCSAAGPRHRSAYRHHHNSQSRERQRQCYPSAPCCGIHAPQMFPVNLAPSAAMIELQPRAASPDFTAIRGRSVRLLCGLAGTSYLEISAGARFCCSGRLWPAAECQSVLCRDCDTDSGYAAGLAGTPSATGGGYLLVLWRMKCAVSVCGWSV